MASRVYVTEVSTYEVVYGALAALPVFLMWVYLCWIIVLAGAAISATLTPAGRGAGKRDRDDRATRASRARSRDNIRAGDEFRRRVRPA